MTRFKGAHVTKGIILVGVWRYVASLLSECPLCGNPGRFV